MPATEFLRKFNLRVEPGWVVFSDPERICRANRRHRHVLS